MHDSSSVSPRSSLSPRIGGRGVSPGRGSSQQVPLVPYVPSNGNLATGPSTSTLPLHSSAGRMVVQRSVEMRERRPERISLERRELTAVPHFPNERQLRSLNLQHNHIITLHNTAAKEGSVTSAGAAPARRGDGDQQQQLQQLKHLGLQCPHIVCVMFFSFNRMTEYSTYLIL